MNSTIEKFGYPHSLVREFDHWLVLVRPAQVTLGSLVLAAKSEATSFSQLEPGAFAEMAIVVRAIETALAKLSSFERINYLMLMMVDPHVHFHVLPRYAEAREWNGRRFPDAGWPAAPDLKSAVELSRDDLQALAHELAAQFEAATAATEL